MKIVLFMLAAFMVTDEVSWANEIMKTQNRFTFLNKGKDNELKLKLKLSLYTELL